MTQRQTGPISQSAEVLLPWLIDIDVFQSGKSSTFGNALLEITDFSKR